MLFSTHILPDVERICTEAAFINDGRIVMQGTIAEMRNRRPTDGYFIEIMQKEAFVCLKRESDNTFVFHGREERFSAILRYIAEKRIGIHKIERIEPTLESLFLEVTK